MHYSFLIKVFKLKLSKNIFQLYLRLEIIKSEATVTVAFYDN